MGEFSTIFKKEWRETIRTKKLLLFTLIAVAMTAFTFILLLLMQLLKSFDLQMPEKMLHMFDLTFENSRQFFSTFMITYFLIALIIFMRNYMSSEIEEKKWVLPMQAGIKPAKLVLARILVATITIIISLAIAMLLHFILTLCICSTSEFIITKTGVTEVVHSYATSIGRLFYSYVNILIAFIFVCVMALTINAISKKGWVSIVVVLLLVIVVNQVCSSLSVGSLTFDCYTPFLFFNQAMGVPGTIGFLPWFVASISTVVIMGLMIIWAISSTKIKGEKTK